MVIAIATTMLFISGQWVGNGSTERRRMVPAPAAFTYPAWRATASAAAWAASGSPR